MAVVGIAECSVVLYLDGRLDAVGVVSSEGVQDSRTRRQLVERCCRVGEDGREEVRSVCEKLGFGAEKLSAVAAAVRQRMVAPLALL